MDAPEPSTNPIIRVAIPHAALPKYRVPVFREFSRRPGIQMKLIYGSHINLPNAEPDGFDGQFGPIRHGHIGHHPVYWHRPMWDYAHPSRADVVMLEWDLHYVLLIPALLRARAHGVGTVIWGHGYSKHEAGWRKWARSNVARLADCLMFYNHTAAQSFIADGWDPKRIHVAINSLDQSPIQAARTHWLAHPEKLEAFRRENGLVPGPVILFVSRLEADNRVDMLLHATKALSQRYPTLKTVIVGKGPDQDSLHALARSLQLGENVRFTGAIYDDMQLAPWYLSARAFCYPANIGLSILHAYGYGLPVITSDRVESQNPEIEAMVHEENGLLYKDGELEAMISALSRIIADDTLALRLSQGALRTATERFTLEKMVDGMVSAVQHAYERSGRAAARA